MALSVHAFLEGTLVSNPVNHAIQSQKSTLLMGILLHKIPAAYALMSIVTCQLKSRRKAISLLLLFALASPAGLFLSDVTFRHQLITSQTFVILFALVSGNFLHISTTIVFESSPQHAFGIRRFSVAVIGALTAIVSEFLLK
jgi:zinc transporter ZupT